MKARANLSALRPEFALDTFCVGLIFLQLFHERGEPVFVSDVEATNHLSGHVQPLIPVKAFRGVRNRFHNVFKQLLAEDPNERSSIQEILNNQIFSKSNRSILAEINHSLEEISSSLSSFSEEALARIAGVRVNTTDGLLALTDLKTKLRDCGNRLDAVSGSDADLRRTLLAETAELARSLMALSGMQAEQSNATLARVDELEKVIREQILSLREDQQQGLERARAELVEHLSSIEDKVDELQAQMNEFDLKFVALSDDIVLQIRQGDEAAKRAAKQVLESFKTALQQSLGETAAVSDEAMKAALISQREELFRTLSELHRTSQNEQVLKHLFCQVCCTDPNLIPPLFFLHM